MAIAIDSTTPVAAGGRCNNGMESVSKTQRPTSQYHSPPFSELGDDRNNNNNNNNNQQQQPTTNNQQANRMTRWKNCVLFSGCGKVYL
jgi:hypothetical protein